MEPRMITAEIDPAGYRLLSQVERHLHDGTLPESTVELVKLRASQLNGCAFCVDLHAHDLKAAGETDERLFSVVTWREAPFFTPAERAALALTEAATRLGPEGVPDDVWSAAQEHYGEKELARLVLTVAVINMWNRLGVATRMPAGLRRRKE